MARCKNSPEVLRVKTELADRLREIRTEQYGERGGPELSRKLNLPVRTWYNYEAGVTVPAEILLRFVELTGTEPRWLLHGIGPKYRTEPPAEAKPRGEIDSVTHLLKQALSLLDARRVSSNPVDPSRSHDHWNGQQDSEDILIVRVPRGASERQGSRGPAFFPLRREWVEGHPDCRCLRHEGDAMEPILAPGSLVGYAARPEAPELLDNALVVSVHEGKPLVRWLQLAGRYALLRPENVSDASPILPIDLESEALAPSGPEFRRVLWSCTPHGTGTERPLDSDWLSS